MVGIRRATWRDVLWLRRLRNDPDAVTQSGGGAVGLATHLRWWWRHGRRRDRCEILVATLRGERAGMARVDREGRAGGVVSLAVDPRYRRRGVASALLKRVASLTTVPLRATVHMDNEASRRAFWRAGFDAHHSWGVWYEYTYRPDR